MTIRILILLAFITALNFSCTEENVEPEPTSFVKQEVMKYFEIQGHDLIMTDDGFEVHAITVESIKDLINIFKKK